jgi:hypothetical protein
MMKNLKQLLFAIALIAGVSASAFAQKKEDKDPPKKPDKPPIIVVEPKKPKDEKPKGDKKPQAMILKNRNKTNFA